MEKNLVRATTCDVFLSRVIRFPVELLSHLCTCTSQLTPSLDALPIAEAEKLSADDVNVVSNLINTIFSNHQPACDVDVTIVSCTVLQAHGRAGTRTRRRQLHSLILYYSDLPNKCVPCSTSFYRQMDCPERQMSSVVVPGTFDGRGTACHICSKILATI